MKCMMAATIALASAFALTFVGCDSSTNADVRDAVFPGAASISLKSDGVIYGNGEAFGVSAIKDASVTKTIYIINKNADTSIALGTIAVSDGTCFTVDTSTSASTIAASGSTSFTVKFGATVTGTFSTTLTVPYTVLGKQRTFTLILAGVSKDAKADTSLLVSYSGDFYETTSSIALPDVGYSGKAAVTLNIHNLGSSEMTLGAPSVSASSGFTLDLTSMSSTLPALAKTSITVTAFPSALGTATTTLSIPYTIDGDSYTYTVSISVTRIAPEQAIQLIYNGQSYASGSTITLPGVTDGTSHEEAITILNKDSSSSLSLGTMTSTGSSEISIGAASLTTIGSGNTATFSAQYAISAIGAISKTLSIPYTIYGTSVTFAVTFSATRTVAPVSQIAVFDPDNATLSSGGAAYDFGYASGGGAILRTFTIRNSGQKTLEVASISSDNGSVFSLSGSATSMSITTGSYATFAVNMTSSAASATATISIVSDSETDKTFTIPLSGGGSEIPATLTGDVGSGLSGHGWDFGYCSGSTQKAISFTYTGSAPLTLSALSLSGGTSYSVVSNTGTGVTSGSSFTATVQYTPTGTSWSSDTLTLGDGKGRIFVVALTGSGFKQPGDLSGGVPSLWLRADRISSSNTLYLDGKYRVDTWPDCRGNGLSADAVYYIASASYLRPVYNSSGINGFPSISFSGTTATDHLRVRKDTGILTTTTGTTTFVAFKNASALDSSRYIIQCFSDTNYSNEVFPRLMYEQRNFDTLDGFYGYSTGSNNPMVVFPFATYGYGAAITRHVLDSDWTNYTTKTGAAYSIALKYDVSKVSPAANMFMWVNGTEKSLGFLYSNGTGYTSATISTGAGYAAFGLPVGNGLGSINPDITANSTYASDYAYTLKTASANHTYFYNRLATTVNTSIAVVSIGAANSSGGNFKGEIAEIIMFPRVLSDTEVTTMNNYLMYKYGISN